MNSNEFGRRNQLDLKVANFLNLNRVELWIIYVVGNWLYFFIVIRFSMNQIIRIATAKGVMK